MPTAFIPNLHLSTSPEDKLKPEFCRKLVGYYWDNTPNVSLLHRKNITEIEDYAAGEFDLTEFKKMYKSQQKEMRRANDPNWLSTRSNEVGIDWHCLSLIVDKFNAAVTLIQKIPVEITVKAIDPLAAEKKQEDLNFLKNKPQIESDLQPIADKLQLGDVDLGATTHSAVPFSDSPYGLDLNEPDELDVFVSLLYALKVEAAFETLLEIFWKLNNGSQVRLLRIRDQLKYGVSSSQAFANSNTGLSDIRYIYPGNIITPESDLPDYSDNTCRFIPENPTITELFDLFGDEICNDETLNLIINGEDKAKLGYCRANGLKGILRRDWSSSRVKLIYCEIRSVDAVGITGNPKSKAGYTYLTSDPEEVKKCKNKVWGSNTYCFWWLENTDYVFGIHKLGRNQRFSTQIYKSQEKSAVELAIRENKIAQEAYIKLQHTIRMSLPPGKMVDLRYMRNAIGGLKDGNPEEVMERLITAVMEHNVMFIDTEGFDGKNDGQFKPYQPIAGGLPMNEIAGYIQIIANCNSNVSRYMGINEQVTGQAFQELVGNNKLAQNASLNAIDYINQSEQVQLQGTFSEWSYQIKDSVEKGGKPKEAIVNMIGSEKVNLIDAIDDFSAHQLSVEIKATSREEERLKLEQSVYNLKARGVLSEADEYMLSAVSNPKDKWKLIAIKQKQFEKREAKKQQDMFAQQQQLAQQQGQNVVAGKAAEAQGEKELVYAKGDVQANMITLQKQLETNQLQLQALIDSNLQNSRNEGQTNKKIKELVTKSNLEQQKAFAE